MGTPDIIRLAAYHKLEVPPGCCEACGGEGWQLTHGVRTSGDYQSGADCEACDGTGFIDMGMRIRWALEDRGWFKERPDA